jgi:D-arabinose 1-dehydrogenase-like Zn-dependent alcohol dehydrogenase
MALQFLNKWGCEVTAFTSSESKAAEAKHLGAHNTLSSTDDAQLGSIAGTLDFILVTANVKLNWQAYLGALRPRGHLHVVGAVLEPLEIAAFPLMVGQKTVSGSPLGSPATTADMLFPVATLMAYLSQYMTLEPGDVLATGTPAGIGAFRTPPLWLSAQDRIEVSIEQIGTLVTTIA